MPLHLISSLTQPFPPQKSETFKTTRDLQQYHARKIKTGRIHDTFAAAEILRFYAVSTHRNLEYAYRVFDHMEEPNCFSWNTMIRAFAESGDESMEALIMFYQMLYDEFVQPNRFTFPSVLKACTCLLAIEEGKQIHAHIFKNGLSNDGFIISNLVRFYAFCGSMDDAHKLFDSYAINMKYFSNNISKEEFEEIKEGNIVIWNVIIDGYLRNGNINTARELFEKMPYKSIISWNVMIAGCAQNAYFKEALEIFRTMQLQSVIPNYVTLVSLLPAISRLGMLYLGEWVHRYAAKNGIKMDHVLGSALIDMYSKCGNVDKALQVFTQLPQKNVVTWTAIIGALAMNGRAKDALHYFSEMEKAEMKPSDVTFVGILSACSHGGLVEEGRTLFKRMTSEFQLLPRTEHYGCMVDMFGRAGLLQEAEEFVANMPIKPDDVIWKGLLGACKLHGDIEMGKRVAKKLMELNPHDSGSYVLLSNIYASLGNWDEVAEVRLKMKEMDIRKDPGSSWIEIDGTLHEFVVQDDKHPRRKEIYSMLEEITENLKSMGYKADASYILLNIDEEEKQSLLSFHSEKIAVAFGLISTKPRTELRITKNLRMCGDCHACLKLISRFYGRRIIVRDRNRFHHFENGMCSCKDYW